MNIDGIIGTALGALFTLGLYMFFKIEGDKAIKEKEQKRNDPS